MENPTCKVACHGVGKFEKKGMTDHAASLAALRAAITLRNEKVVANVQQKVHFDDSELRAMAKTQKCPVPGVHFHQGQNSWMACWYEQKKKKKNQCYFSVKKFEAPGMTEDEASLAALRSTIVFRADKVGLHHHGRTKMIRIIEEGL